jgi:cytochrome c oxidase subunit 3
MNASARDLRRRGLLGEQYDDPGQQRETSMFGMWVFLATEVLFFGVLFTGYTVCRIDSPEGFLIGSQHTELLFGAVEAGILLLSSAIVTVAINLAGTGARRLITALLAITALLGLTFLVLHGVEYAHEYQEHLMVGVDFDQSSPFARGMEMFFFLYYAMTLYHSLHVLVAVCVISVIATMVWRGKITADKPNAIVVAGLYWHFVDIVWIFLFPLMYLIGR